MPPKLRPKRMPPKLPPKRKASAVAAAAADSPAAQRQKKAEPVASEETTEVNVFVFDARWQQKLHELYTERKLTDVVLVVGDRSVAAHRVILATMSPHLQALFGSQMAESQSREVELQQLEWSGVKAIVDFAYTGTIALSGATVVSIIQAANLLQVEAVERAAVKFLVERLDAGNVLSAMALGEHLSAGAIGRELRDSSILWIGQHLDEMAAEPSFLALSGAEVAALIAADSVEAREEEVFAAVLAWVKKDQAARKAELDQLLPLVRFPRMKEPAAAMMAEPLVAQHALGMQLVFETHPEFAKSPQAASCPRLVARKAATPQFNHLKAKDYEKKLVYEDALAYVQRVKTTFAAEPEVFKEFLAILAAHSARSEGKTAALPALARRVAHMFRAHPALVSGFERFRLQQHN